MQRTILITFVCTLLSFGLAQPAFCQSGGGYDLSWSTIDAGGLSLASGGAFELAGTAGQCDAGRHSSYPSVVAGGFWLAGLTPCRVDWNADGFHNSQDFFDFMTSFFHGNADFNFDGWTNSQDFFDFIAAFFEGC